MSSQNENVIREKRTIEANKKNLMGPSGKLGVILEAFGTAIVKQGSSLHEERYFENPYEDDVYTERSPTLSGEGGPISYRDEILTYEDEFMHNEGLMFDGLSRGMHLEIVYWHAENKLKVNYKGYTVYLEIAGELESYAPFEEWENLIEKLFLYSKKKLKENKKIKEQKMIEEIDKKKRSFLENLRMRWGI